MPRSRLRPFVIVVLVAVAAVAAWKFFQQKPITVVVQPVTRGTVEKVVANTRAGTLKACRQANLSPGVGGQIARLQVSEGDQVNKGQLLLELWNKDLAAQLVLTESQLCTASAHAEAAHQRTKIAAREATRLLRLQPSGAVSEQETDNKITEANIREAEYAAAKADAETSRARLGVINAELERTRLIAPFTGIVAKINGELNEFVTPSPAGIATPPTVVLLDTTCFYVTAPIDEVDAPDIQVGMKARIILDAYGERHFAGTVRRISPYVLDVEKQARTVDVEVEFCQAPENTILLAGYSADVEIIAKVSPDTIRIPTQTIIDGKKVYVYASKDGRLHSRDITTGISNWEQTEVTGGLREGEQVLTSIDRDGVEDNAKVTITEGP